MTTSKTIKCVQLRANHKVYGHVEPAQDRGEVEFYSLYLGEPGNYQWMADFASDSDAVNAVRYMVLAFDCEVDRSQYDAVMQTSAPKTITVNGFQVPAPIAKPPADSELVWVAVSNNPDFAAHVRYVSRGLLHTTREAAVAHAKAMLGIDPKGDA